MARAIWSGAISFGLITIPVKLFNGTSSKSVRFNQLDGRSGSRVRQKLVSAADDSDVDRDDIVRGFEISKGNYVTITNEELDAVDPVASRSIEILEFVEEADIDPLFYNKAYYLVPDELAAKAYVVLVEALEKAGKVAIAKVVMRTKQYVAAVRPADGHLMLSTMVYSDEVNAFENLDGVEHMNGVEVRDAEIDMAMALIDSLTAEFEPEKYKDEHRERILEMIQRKSDGEEIVIEAPAAVADNTVVDLMAALEASVAAAKEARGRHPSGEGAEDAPAKKKASAKKKTTAKKKTASKSKAAAKKAS